MLHDVFVSNASFAAWLYFLMIVSHLAVSTVVTDVRKLQWLNTAELWSY